MLRSATTPHATPPKGEDCIEDLKMIVGHCSGTSGPGILRPLAPAPQGVHRPRNLACLRTSITAGIAFSVTITAQDAYNNTVTGYLGTVHFTSTDSTAGLPANYTFTAADHGVHTFSSGVILKTAGSQTFTATDTTNGALTGTAPVTVTPATATHFSLTAPASSVAGTAFNLTVKALDAYGNIAAGYTGTVHFTSTDAAALLPANYKFLASDAGVHSFTATLKTGGSQTLTATDTVASTISGSAVIVVGTGPSGPGGGQGGKQIVPSLAAQLSAGVANPSASALPSGADTATAATQASLKESAQPAIALVSARGWSPAAVDLAFAGKSHRDLATTSSQKLDRIWEEGLIWAIPLGVESASAMSVL